MSEQHIENDLIQKLQDLGYSYRADIHDRAALEVNFRQHFQTLNRVHLSDAEFARLLDTVITPDVYAASKTLRETNSFTREDGTPLHYTLINNNEWCKNTFEVVNQLRINTASSHHRYDVVLLINGIPVTQIELKALAISPNKAMQQIVEYKNDPGNGYIHTLLCFIQLFIVSNQYDTYYFANNNQRHFSFNADERFLPVYKFADEANKKITHLHDFADAFLAKCSLAEMIDRYMVLIATEQKLLMMRPYQIYAVKRILQRIDENAGNGFIWHTTGSGKTLTSFKASTLLKQYPNIDKCLFVVDRKDLDKQTRDEFNKFQTNCVEENTNTASLVERLLSTDYANKVIVTTIQKLGIALTASDGATRNFKDQLAPLRHKRMVFIFDECHRSQFGENHKAIKEFFPNSQLFGFTGTPIFEENSNTRQIEGDQASFKTTADLFHQQLHAYTITHAIDDGNVLRFHVDYFRPEAPQPTDPTLQKQAIVTAILQKHAAATADRKFNALFATASINDAIQYFQLFNAVQTERLTQDPTFNPLNIACVFSPPAEGDPDIKQIQQDLPQEQEDNKQDPEAKKQALREIIAQYNTTYNTNHSLNNFDQYYQDVQLRFKSHQYPNTELPHTQKIDIIIVVDMLLTGFDSKYLNTLYVDKNLRYHSLIQAFSRVNRVLNNTKPYGNILDFRYQEHQVNEAIALFSGEQVERSTEIWLVEPAPVIIDKLNTAVAELKKFMTDQGLQCLPQEVANLHGDVARADFINKFKEVQRLETQLDQYTDLTPQQTDQIETILPTDHLKGFRVAYLQTAQRLKPAADDPNSPPEVQQLDFEYILFASALIDYDYIMKLIAQSTGQKPAKQKLSRDQLIALISADAKFIDEREDLVAYINSLDLNTGITEQAIRDGYQRFKQQNITTAITALAATHNLPDEDFNAFVKNTTDRLILDEDALTDLLLPLNLGWKDRNNLKRELMRGLIPILNKLTHNRPISGTSAYEN